MITRPANAGLESKPRLHFWSWGLLFFILLAVAAIRFRLRELKGRIPQTASYVIILKRKAT